jgi:hypothetical protein
LIGKNWTFVTEFFGLTPKSETERKITEWISPLDDDGGTDGIPSAFSAIDG